MSGIGIFSGTFDPLHQGHIAFAKAALAQGALERVVFLPEPRPRHKPAASAHQERTLELETHIANYPNFSVANVSSDRFTVASTLPQLEALYGKQLVLLLGSDVALGINSWLDKELLIQRVSFIIGMRANDETTDVESIFTTLGARYQIVMAAYDDLSSTQLRQPDHLLQ